MQGGSIVLMIIMFFQSTFLITIDASPRLSSAAPSESPSSPSDGDKQVYIVYMSAQPPQGLNLHSYYLNFLSSVLGSEEAAKDAIVYTYTVIAGFSAKLTPQQASLLDEQPEVVYVLKEIDYSLDGENISSASWRL